MSEKAKTEQDDAPREQAQPESTEVDDTDLENVSGGGPGGNTVISQPGGGTGPASL